MVQNQYDDHDNATHQDIDWFLLANLKMQFELAILRYKIDSLTKVREFNQEKK